jgi:hypothetical protein
LMVAKANKQTWNMTFLGNKIYQNTNPQKL